MRTKRIFDLCLVLPLAPLLALAIGVLALGVWVVDGRPLFFRQVRLGRGRRPFRIWKLRSMTPEADPARRTPTRFGGWLRHRGLDELPQVINVLTGEMSLVGPRPLTPGDGDRLSAQYAPFAERYAVPPGITGLAQICGAHGAALTARLDADYARARTVASDFAILVRTLWINVVGKRRGARPVPAEQPSSRP